MVSHLCFPIKLVNARQDIPLFKHLKENVKPKYHRRCYVATAENYPLLGLEFSEEVDYLSVNDIVEFYDNIGELL